MTTHPVQRRIKLIEVAIPLKAINAASAREKSIRPSPSDASSAATPPPNGLSLEPARSFGARSPSQRPNIRPKPASGKRFHHPVDFCPPLTH